MPIMDGLTATETIIEKLKGKSPPIIALTANVLEEDREKCFKSGMVGFLAKPLDRIELSQLLKRFCTSLKNVEDLKKNTA